MKTITIIVLTAVCTVGVLGVAALIYWDRVSYSLMGSTFW